MISNSLDKRIDPVSEKAQYHIIIFGTFILVTLMTASHLDEIAPSLSRVIRLAGYLATAGGTAWALLPALKNPVISLRDFWRSYRFTLFLPLSLYFLGLIIGSLRGPDPAYALQQTVSDAVVFAFALAVFGWLSPHLEDRTSTLLRVTSLVTLLLLVGSLIIYIGNLQGWWLINPYYHYISSGQYRMLMNGPFTHSNHLAYVLMMGSLAAASLATISKKAFDWAWWIIAGIMAVGVAITFGRGAMLGTATGVIAILFTRHRRLAWPLLAGSVLLLVTVLLATQGILSLPSFIPKVTFAGRAEMWSAAIENINLYGPLGVGAGQAESWPGWTMHNFFLEQLGEGGVLTLVGVILWLALPIVKIRTSRLEPLLAWCIAGMMLGLMVHGIFWGQFLNGLRILTLVYVCLWTALGTQRIEPPDPAPSPT